MCVFDPFRDIFVQLKTHLTQFKWPWCVNCESCICISILLATNVGSMQGPLSSVQINLSLNQCSCFYILCSLLLSKGTVEVIDNINQTWCLLASLPLCELHIPLGEIFDCSVDNAQQLLTACDIIGLLSHSFKGTTRLFEDWSLHFLNFQIKEPPSAWGLQGKEWATKQKCNTTLISSDYLRISEHQDS